MTDDQREQADALRGVLRISVGGEEVRLRKLKLHPAEESFDRNAKALGPIAQVDVAEIESDLQKAADLMRRFSSALLEAIVDYDAAGALGGTEKLAEDLYPDELLPIFLAMRDAALPFVDLLRDRRPPVGVSVSPSSTSGLSPSGSSTPTSSARASTRASSKPSGAPPASV